MVCNDDPYLFSKKWKLQLRGSNWSITITSEENSSIAQHFHCDYFQDKNSLRTRNTFEFRSTGEVEREATLVPGRATRTFLSFACENPTQASPGSHRATVGIAIYILEKTEPQLREAKWSEEQAKELEQGLESTWYLRSPGKRVHWRH